MCFRSQSNLIYLWFIHPRNFGPLPLCRAQNVAREQRSPVLTVIEAGKAVLVLVALAYRLVLCSLETPRRNFIVEEVRAMGEVLADLSDYKTTKPGQNEEQGCWWGQQRVQVRNPVDQTVQMRWICWREREDLPIGFLSQSSALNNPLLFLSETLCTDHFIYWKLEGDVLNTPIFYMISLKWQMGKFLLSAWFWNMWS